MELLGKLVVAVGVQILGGWIATYIWEWFVVPFGAPSIHLAWAIGLSCLVARYPRGKDDKEFVETVIGVLVWLFFIWLTAFVASFFM